MGVERYQLRTLVLDFLNLYLVSVYILHYRNPILVKTMQKVFWSFPSVYDGKEKWERLEKKVHKQVMWLYNPVHLMESRYAP